MKTKAQESKPTKRRVVTKVIEITPEQLLNGIQRFDRVCRFVETQMQHTQPGPAPRSIVGLGDAAVPQTTKPLPPAPIPSVEDRAGTVAQYSNSLAERAESLVIRLHGGANPQSANGAAMPSAGPIKDSLAITLANLDRINDALNQVTEYIGG